MMLVLELLAMLAPRHAEATMIQVTVVLVLLAPLVLLRLVLLATFVPDRRSHETS